MSQYITQIEQKTAAVETNGTEPFKEARLEKFAILVGSGITSPYEAFRESFDVAKTESGRLVGMRARTLERLPGMYARIKIIRKQYISDLKKEVLVEKVEGIAVLASRLRDPMTASRDLVPIYRELSDSLGWNKEDEGTEIEDPIQKLLREISNESKELPEKTV